MDAMYVCGDGRMEVNGHCKHRHRSPRFFTNTACTHALELLEDLLLDAHLLKVLADIGNDIVDDRPVGW